MPSALRPKIGQKPRLKHQPTEQTRTIVRLGMAAGMTEENVSRLLEITPQTLRTHYRDELERGALEINIKIAGNLAAIASNPNHKQAVAAGKWWTACRMGWKPEGKVIEVAGAAAVDGTGKAITKFTIRIGDAGPGAEAGA